MWVAQRSARAAPVVGVALWQGRRNIPYAYMTITLLSECAKFGACLVYILVFMDRKTAFEHVTVKESLLYAVPALLYMVDNNIVFAILLYIDAAVMSIVWNCKIVITALLFRFVLKRRLTTLKWLSGEGRGRRAALLSSECASPTTASAVFAAVAYGAHV